MYAQNALDERAHLRNVECERFVQDRLNHEARAYRGFSFLMKLFSLPIKREKSFNKQFQVIRFLSYYI